MSSSSQSGTGSGRIVSIDALRGFDMFWICGGREVFLAIVGLFVAEQQRPAWFKHNMDHVDWIGFSAWDLIMPLFLFVVGASMPFAFARRLESGKSTIHVYLRILRRFLLLWILGMVAQGRLLEARLDRLYFFSNTLQSIAVGYLVASILLLHVSVLVQFLVMIGLLVGYCLLMAFVAVPGHEAGIIDPKLNLARHIDEIVLGRFRDGTTYTWILSGMGFAATVLLGVMGGHLLRSGRTQRSKLLWLVGSGVGCLALGWIWGRWFPIIKHIWSSSMVLWAGGWSFLLLALFYGLIDVLGWRRWSFPFVVIGMNAIVAYMAPRLIPFGAIGDKLTAGLAAQLGPAGALLKALAGFMVLWLMLWYMCRKKTFIKV
jgi:predicted acyltransferase